MLAKTDRDTFELEYGNRYFKIVYFFILGFFLFLHWLFFISKFISYIIYDYYFLVPVFIYEIV